jgi:uroporphyrinogen decarboxylase
MQNRFLARIRSSPGRLPVPISTYPGLLLTGARVSDVLSDPSAQVDAQLALHDRFDTPVLLSAMDLSAEAEAFGCAICLPDDEIPSVIGRPITSTGDINRLSVPSVGDKRTAVPLEAVRRMRRAAEDVVVLGEMIGPFSLAAQLVGITEIMCLCATDPGAVEALVLKATAFLTEYSRAFAQAGADGVVVAEPVAGLVSPAGLGRFSSAAVAVIRQAVEDGPFRIILHNCGARLVHLTKILEAGASMYHFGAPMDLASALGQIPPDIVVAGNLDPARVFCQGTAEGVRSRTFELLAATARYPNFVPSSGCDLPPRTPLANLGAFYDTVRTAGSGPLKRRRADALNKCGRVQLRRSGCPRS